MKSDAITKLYSEQCEAWGVDGVREKLATGELSGAQRSFALMWLDSVLAAEQLEIDRRIARNANKVAIWVGLSGNLIALAALVVALYAALN